jgi:hypothetical protein
MKNFPPEPLKSRNSTVRAYVIGLLIIGIIAGGFWVSTAVFPSPTPTPIPTHTINPDQQMATRIIQIATSTAIALTEYTPTTPTPYLTPTPVPTLTEYQLETLRSRFQNDLESAAGFSHPAFDEYVDEIVSRLAWRPAFFLNNYHLEPLVARGDFQGSAYVAIIPQWVTELRVETQLFIFRVTDNMPTLLLTKSWFPTGFYIAFADYYSTMSRTYDFTDVNGNQYPDFAVDWNSGGSCGTGGISLFEIQPNGEIADITPEMGARFSYLTDINDDGVSEFLSIQNSGDIPLPRHGCVPYSENHYYGWNGSAYVDISPTVDVLNYPNIGRYWIRVYQQQGCILPGEVLGVLIDYRARGQLAEMWTLIQPELRWDACSSEVLVANQQAMTDLETWVATEIANSTP